jgi:hypothetical protein
VKRDFRPADAGIIRGNVFNDANHNGTYDAGEGTPNVLVYIDSHRDGRRNNAELYSRTNADGAYRFTGLGPGVYRVRETLPDATVLTTPAAGFYDVVLGAGRIVGGKSFANNAAPGTSSRAFAHSPSTLGRTDYQTDRIGPKGRSTDYYEWTLDGGGRRVRLRQADRQYDERRDGNREQHKHRYRAGEQIEISVWHDVNPYGTEDQDVR